MVGKLDEARLDLRILFRGNPPGNAILDAGPGTVFDDGL
jgi:hypothetical protein